MSKSEQPDESTSIASPKTRSRLTDWFADWIAERTKALFCVGVLLTLFSFAARRHWLADLLANLRMQQVIGLLVLCTTFLLLRRWRWAVAAGAITLLHLPWFLSAIEPTQRGGEPALSVMVANVLTSNPHHDRIVSQIKSQSPEVLAILELGTPLHLKLESELAKDYPYRVAVPQDLGNFGIGVYSKLPFQSEETFSLNIDNIPSVAVTVTKNGHHYHVIATHPLPPIGSTGFRDRNEHLSRLAERIAIHGGQHQEDSLIVVGDLNLTPWSPLMSDFEKTTKLRRAGRGFGFTPTWYFRKPTFPLGLVLDHGLISADLNCSEHIVCDSNGSDHRAIHLRLARSNRD